MPWSQTLCLPCVRELLRNGREGWLEKCPGPHVLAPLLECQGWTAGLTRKGSCHQSIKEPWPDNCIQFSRILWQGVSSLTGRWECRGGPDCQRILRKGWERDWVIQEQSWDLPASACPLPQNEQLGRSQQCAWNGTKRPVPVVKPWLLRAATAGL